MINLIFLHLQNSLLFMELLMFIGIFTAVVSIVTALNRVLENKTKLVLKKARSSLKARALRPPSSLYRALKIQQGRSFEFTGKVLEKVRWFVPQSVTGNIVFVIVTIITSLWLFGFCTNYLRNPLAGIISIAACVLTFSRAFSVSVNKSMKTEEYSKQLPSSIRIFGTVLSDTGNFTAALESTSERSPEPVKTLFLRVHEKINSGETPEDALKIIPKTLKTSHSEMLANVLVEACKHGTAALPMFVTLADQIDNNYKLELKNKSFLIPARLTSIVMHIFIVILIAMTTIMVTDAKNYITDPIGKMLVTFYFVTVVISVIADKMFGVVEG